jgi:hypothetical protein
LAFWHGVALAANGREQEARAQLDQAYRAGDGWRELLRRLPAAGLFPDDPELITRLTLSGRQDASGERVRVPEPARPAAPTPAPPTPAAPPDPAAAPPRPDPAAAPPPPDPASAPPPPRGFS